MALQGHLYLHDGHVDRYPLAVPLSGAVMNYVDGLGDHHDWQWLFVVQSLPPFPCWASRPSST